MQPKFERCAQARKRAELDAQLLANRIALLKQEEEKAWKKIEETRAPQPRDGQEGTTFTGSQTHCRETVPRGNEKVSNGNVNSINQQ